MPETGDIDLKGIGAGAAIIAGGIAFSLGISLFFFQTQEPFVPPPVSGPVLLTAPLQERDAYAREKNAQLHSSGPVPGAPGWVHIPIEQAMRRLAR